MKQLDHLQRPLWIISALGVATCIAGALWAPVPFYRSYLSAYIFWSGIGLGSLAILMVHHSTGGAWGGVLRHFLEASTRTLPHIAFLSLPMLVGIRHVYVWAGPMRGEVIGEKGAYLDVPFFLLRSAIYFGIWLYLSYVLNRWSRLQDEGGSPPFRGFSAKGLVLYGMAVTFASIDWIMSLQPNWYSTIFGVIFASGQALSAFAFAVVMLNFLAGEEAIARVLTPLVLKDLGNLLLAFLMLWTYLTFSQFLIIWSGNLHEEIPWYLSRSVGGWQWIAVILFVGYFAVPFLLLLTPEIKRQPRLLASVAGVIVALGMVAQFWLVAPAFYKQLVVRWTDLAAFAGVGGLWMIAYIKELQSRPLVPLHSPQIEEALEVA